MLMSLTVALAVLPARSVALPVTDWPVPSVLTVASPVQVAMPETESEQEKLTETSVLFQPFALGAGVREPLMYGAVLSIFTVTEDELVKPDPFVAEQVTVVPVVSEVRVRLSHPVEEAMPDSGSDTDHAIVTSLTYQPLFPEVPVAEEEMIGAVVSAGSDSSCGSATFKLITRAGAPVSLFPKS